MKKLLRRFSAAALAAMTAVCMSTAVSASIPEPEYDDAGKIVIPSEPLVERVVDGGDILTDSEEQQLLDTCNEISERQHFDVTIATTGSLGDRTATEYADDYYDYNGLGYGVNRDGILLLISMEDRDWAISTFGTGIPYFTDAGQSYMVDQFKPYLSNGKYYEAFDIYARLCDDFINQARSDDAYDTGNMPTHSVIPFKNVFAQKLKMTAIVSLVISFLVWLVICMIEKSKLTSVSFKGQADDYIKRDSFVINQRSDNFLYKNVTKRYNPPPESSGGGGSHGSSTHTSSSGGSHGGSSGKF